MESCNYIKIIQHIHVVNDVPLTIFGFFGLIPLNDLQGGNHTRNKLRVYCVYENHTSNKLRVFCVFDLVYCLYDLVYCLYDSVI